MKSDSNCTSVRDNNSNPTLKLLSHLVYFGQSALLVSSIASPHWSRVPQGTLLLQAVIHIAIFLAALALKSIDIHGGLHGRAVLKAPSAAAPHWLCGPATSAQLKAKRVKAEIHIMWQLWWTCIGRSKPHIPSFSPLLLSTFPDELQPADLRRKKMFVIPLQTVPFLSFFCSLCNLMCQKSAKHEKTATSYLDQHLLPASLTLSFSMD